MARCAQLCEKSVDTVDLYQLRRLAAPFVRGLGVDLSLRSPSFASIFANGSADPGPKPFVSWCPTEVRPLPGSPDRWRIKNSLAETLAAADVFPWALLFFAVHNFDDPESILWPLTERLSPHISSIVVADYDMQGIGHADFLRRFTLTLERAEIASKGFRRAYDLHTRYSYATVEDILGVVGYRCRSLIKDGIRYGAVFQHDDYLAFAN